MFSSADTIWVLLAATLVFFMQAGFAMVETGFTRAKNAGNIIMKNLMDFALGSLVFWAIGFGLMQGASLGGWIGTPDFFIRGSYGPGTIPTAAFVIFQTVFAATAATIVSGSMAERTKFVSYCIYSVVITAVIYPISGHWIWGGGWLSQLGFHDFAGSTAVHMVGGIAALIGAKALGPRIGKYGADGKPKAILGHSITLGALGVFILWFGWFGFNPGSTLSATGDGALRSMSDIFVTTNLAAAAGATVAMVVTWVRYKKPDVSVTLNGALGGLVAITAGCDAVSPWGAALIGAIAGVLIVAAIELLDKKFKIDDPVGAVPVHCVCGAAGTLMVGLFAVDGGLFYGGGFKLLGVQLLGVAAVAVWVTVTMVILFGVLKKTVGLRVSAAEEIAGLDSEEHGLASAYADFMPVTIGSDGAAVSVASESAPMEQAVPVVHRKAAAPTSDVKMTKVDIITNPHRFEMLKDALGKIGITGITVTNVMGCGMQNGGTEFYRGVPVDINLLPKIRLEIIVCKVPVETVVDAAKKALYTGKIGDGKIFIYDVENVIKVRTGEEGYAALQDE
ncbi:MAG: ammonium transporter [Candidatus Limiplasma sp.]|nr:ammonium transporter [Candidatus Limiplasma sp.]